MSENSCILVKEIDCDNVVLIEEIKTAVIVTPNPEVVIVACEQGPAGQDGADGVNGIDGADGADGLDGVGVVEVSSGPISNGNTVVADSVVAATIRSVKWLVTITDSVAGDYKTYEVLGVHNGTTALYSVYGIVGDSISVFTNVVINGANMELELTNNSTNDLDIKVQRIATTV